MNEIKTDKKTKSSSKFEFKKLKQTKERKVEKKCAETQHLNV